MGCTTSTPVDAEENNSRKRALTHYFADFDPTNTSNEELHEFLLENCPYNYEWEDQYVVERELARTYYFCVNVVTKSDTGDQFVLKWWLKEPPEDEASGDSEDRAPPAEVSRENFLSEWGCLSTSQHPNIARAFDAFQDNERWVLVSEYCSGGDLFSAIVERQRYTEKDAVALLRQLLSALEYLHSRNVAHRDVKPENVVLASPDSLTLKLIDFGCAVLRPDDEQVKDVVGSPYFIAPEALEVTMGERPHLSGREWRAADMWSVGVVAYVMLIGDMPFKPGRNQKNCVKNIFLTILAGRYGFPKHSVTLSTSAKSFIRALLRRKGEDRLSATEALGHPFLASNTTDTPLDRAVLDGLTTRNNASLLRRQVALSLMAHNSDVSNKAGGKLRSKESQELQELFKQFDRNKDGRLGPEEIAEMMRHLAQAGNDEAGQLASAEELAASIEAYDIDGDGAVSLEEAAAFVHERNLATNQYRMKRAFKKFDKDRSGDIDIHELCAMCQHMSPEAAEELIATADTNHDGKISYDEWVAAMKKIKDDPGKARLIRQKSLGPAEPLSASESGADEQ